MPPLHLRALPDGPGSTPGTEAVRGGATGLVLRVAGEGLGETSFVGRRAADAVARLPSDGERRQLRRVLENAPDPCGCSEALVVWAAQLESAGRISEGVRAMDVALCLSPDDPSLVLHAARLARKADDRARARRLYDRVAELDAGDGRLGRLAVVGRALVSQEPEPALTRALRLARGAGDAEATAVAQEARAGIRRERGDVGGALRDYVLAAARYEDPLDIGRIGHEVADLLVSVGDLPAARLVLLETAHRARPRQSLWARSRLLVLSRALGDQVGMRRWADVPTPPFASLLPRRAGTVEGAASRRGALVRWIRRIAALSAT